MFYSHDILQKRGGKFGIIWIAATKGVALSKRDYCSVCVTKSCDDIVKYITLQALPTRRRKGSRPRFSLYLSSQLMVGVARVFEKQVNYFIVDVNELHKRTTSFRASSFDDDFTTHVQLKKSTRLGDFCTMPESTLFNDEEFGMMRGSWDTSPDPLLLPEIEMFSVSPYRTAKLSTSLLELSPTQMDKLVLESPPHVVSSASEISLRDEESYRQEEIQIPDIELPPLEGVDDDLMTNIYEDMAVADQIHENEGETNLSQLSNFGLDQLWEVDNHTGQLMLSPPPKGAIPRHSSPPHRSLLDQLSPIPSREAPLSPTRPGVLEPVVDGTDVEAEPLEVEGAELEEEVDPKKPSNLGMETPGTGPVLQNILRLSPIDSISPSPVRRRGRKRRLVFADDSIQMSKKDIRHNMETVGDLARKETIFTPSHPTAKELFEEPARKALKKNTTLHALWKSHSELRTATTDPEAEDIDAPAWSTAYMRPRAALPGSSSDTTSKEDQEEEEEEDERALLVKQIPEVLRHEISVSPERMRDISMETSQPRTKFEDTPHSITVSDASHLSESKDSSRVKSFHSDPPTGHRSLHHLTGDSFKEMEDAIPEELMDMRELPLLPEEDIMMDQLEEQPELAIPSAPEMTSTSEDEEVRKAKKKKQGKKKQEETIVPQDNVLRGIGVLTEEVDSISFTDLVPPRTYRSVAAKIFSVCLEYAAMRLITLSQERPFGNIKIRRGPDFD